MIPSRTDVIRAYRDHGGRVAAVLPVHYPRALLRAFDILPVEAWGPPGVDPAAGSAHVQPYICSIVRNSLSFLLGDSLSLVDLVIVPHACDSLQGLGSLLVDFVDSGRPVLPIYLPRGGGRASDIEFLAAEFRSLYGRLAELTGCRPTDEELMASIKREERADALLARVHRERGQLALSMPELYRLIRSREFLPADEFCAMASAALEQPPTPTLLPPAALGDPGARFAGEGRDRFVAKNAPRNDASQTALESSPQEKRGIPIILSGIVPEPKDIFSALGEMGGYIAADDLACCRRRLYPAGASDEPFTRMAERILNGPPDSTRGSSIAERLAHLVGLARETEAKGVVFWEVKFCEPELFYLPLLRKGLSAEGIGSVVIEVDLNDPFTAPVRTRLEAFLEMLQ